MNNLCIIHSRATILTYYVMHIGKGSNWKCCISRRFEIIVEGSSALNCTLINILTAKFVTKLLCLTCCVLWRRRFPFSSCQIISDLYVHVGERLATPPKCLVFLTSLAGHRMAMFIITDILALTKGPHQSPPSYNSAVFIYFYPLTPAKCHE